MTAAAAAATREAAAACSGEGLSPPTRFASAVPNVDIAQLRLLDAFRRRELPDDELLARPLLEPRDRGFDELRFAAGFDELCFAAAFARGFCVEREAERPFDSLPSSSSSSCS